MDRESFEAALQLRREVLGSEYVDRAMADPRAFSRPFQDLATELV